MSDILFDRPDRKLKLRLTALAAVACLVLAAGSAWLGLSFIGVVGRDVPITVQVTSFGDSLGVNSSVKFRGLRVGRVMKVDKPSPSAPTFTVRAVVERQYADHVPASVIARVLPGSIFGADFIDLVAPGESRSATASGAGLGLRGGAVIAADTSAPTVRLMDTFNATQRILGAIDPAAMATAVSQLADALDGQGGTIRGFITRTAALLDQVGDIEPTFYEDLALLGRNAALLADLEPVLARTLRDSLPVARTLAAKAQNTEKLLRSTTALAASITPFLDANGPGLARMLDAVAPTYDAFVGGIEPFSTILERTPGVMRNGADAVKGNAVQMIAQFNLDLISPYTAADCPRYGPLKGRNCR